MRMIAALVLMSVSVPAWAQDGYRQFPTPNTVSVSGEGTVFTQPDTATIQSGVTTQAVGAREALDLNNEAMSKVIDAYKSAGIPASDISTSGFSVQPQYTYDNENGQPPKLVGYQVSNNLSVRIRDLDLIGTVLDTAVSSGSNQINGLNFSVSDVSGATDEARGAAMDDAWRKAEIYAGRTNSRLGHVISVSEGTAAYQPPMPYARMEAMSMAAPSSVPVQAGTQELKVGVSVVWELIPLAITQ